MSLTGAQSRLGENLICSGFSRQALSWYKGRALDT